MEGISRPARSRFTEPNPIQVPRKFTRHSDGRVSLILSAGTDHEWKTLQGSLAELKDATLRATIPLVRSVVADVPESEVFRTIDQLPVGTTVYADAPLRFPTAATILDREGRRPHQGEDMLCAVGGQTPFTVGADDDLGKGQADALVAGENGAVSDVDRDLVGLPRLHRMGYTGKGVTVAVIDSGIAPVPDLKPLKGWKDMDGDKPVQYDLVGHGTHVAGEIAATGGKLEGAAPDADLVGVRVTTVVQAVAGLQWTIDHKDEYGIQIVNLSMGDPSHDSYTGDLWSQMVEKAIDAGLIVIVAAGNEGPDPGSVSTPGIDPRAITVGALDDGKTADRRDDKVAEFSSRGPTVPDGILKPDLVAPGVHVFSTLAPGSVLDVPELPHLARRYLAISGTSMAVPLVTGVVAAMLQANPNLKQAEVKEILMATAQKYLSDSPVAQGAGVLDGVAAVKEALRRAHVPTQADGVHPWPAAPQAVQLPLAFGPLPTDPRPVDNNPDHWHIGP